MSISIFTVTCKTLRKSDKVTEYLIKATSIGDASGGSVKQTIKLGEETSSAIFLSPSENSEWYLKNIWCYSAQYTTPLTGPETPNSPILTLNDWEFTLPFFAIQVIKTFDGKQCCTPIHIQDINMYLGKRTTTPDFSRFTIDFSPNLNTILYTTQINLISLKR